MDAANVDLKGFSEEFYRELTNSHLAPVQDTLRWLARESNVWLEVTNLLIPGKNDSEEELKRMCALAGRGPGARRAAALHGLSSRFPHERRPAHAACHPGEGPRDRQARRAELCLYGKCRAIAARQSTYCPSCGQVLVGRDGYRLSVYGLQQDRCRGCGMAIAGRFGDGRATGARAACRFASRNMPGRKARCRPFPSRLENKVQTEPWSTHLLPGWGQA